MAIHKRDFTRKWNRHIFSEHLPANSVAYREATPQNLLSQARFISDGLRAVVAELFEKDTLGNIRRAQGLIRRAHKEIQDAGREQAEIRITEAIAQMRRFNNFRVRYFEATLTQLKKKSKSGTPINPADREIHRLPGNPMLRYTQVAEVREQMDIEELLPRTDGEMKL